MSEKYVCERHNFETSSKRLYEFHLYMDKMDDELGDISERLHSLDDLKNDENKTEKENSTKDIQNKGE